MEELETFKMKSEEDLAQKEVVKEGTCLWLISKLSQNIFPDISKEIDFLYTEVLPILNENENDQSKGNEENVNENSNKTMDFSDKIEQIVKDLTMVTLTHISEKLAFLKLSNMQVRFNYISKFL